MKIGIDGRYAEGKLTGIGQYIEHLVHGLSERDFEAVIFYTKEPLNNFLGKNITSVILPSTSRYHFEQVLLPKALREYKVNLYHAAGNVGVPVFCPKPSVLTVHDIIPLLYPDYFSFSQHPLISKSSFFLRTALSLRFAKKIMADSQFTKDCLIKKFKVSSEKITVVPLGIETKKGSGKLPEGIKKGKYILNNGGIDIRKNLFRLIEAFAKISPRLPFLKLVITGENKDLRPKLEEAAKRLNIDDLVVFPGYLDEESLWTLIRNASCLCLPTEMEGFGFPVLAGMTVGVPVVASNTSSIPEIAGDAVLLVNPLKVEEIVLAMEKVLIDRDLRERLMKEGLEQAKKFTWEKTIDKTIEIYNEALK